MLIAIILIVLNVLIVGALLFILRGLDSAPKFQIPCDETKLTDNKTTITPWEYYTSLRRKSWNELSPFEKERMTIAAHLILDECGTLSTLSEVEAFIETPLPEMPSPNADNDGVLGGFREWKDSNK